MKNDARSVSVTETAAMKQHGMRRNLPRNVLRLGSGMVAAGLLCTGLFPASCDRGGGEHELVETQSAATVYTPTSRDVLTQHNAASRTGATLETTLTTSNVNPQQFGLVKRLPVDGRVYAQVLYKQNVVVAGVSSNLVFAATAKNTVYAFHESTWTPAWPALNLGTPAPSVTCYGVCPYSGIVGTPVISAATNRMYVVAEVMNGSTAEHRLFTIDITTGTLVGSYVTLEGSGRPVVSKNLQRAGLALLGNYLYIAFTQNADQGTHGLMAVYDVSTMAPTLRGWMNASPGSNGAGIWQSGVGPAGDESDPSNAYVLTGNSQAVAPPGISTPPYNSANAADVSNAFLRINTGASAVTVADGSGYHVPGATVTYNGSTHTWSESPYDGGAHSQQFTGQLFNAGNTDLDLGSGGPVLLPPDVVAGVGKEGYLFSYHRGSIGAGPNDMFRIAHNGQIGITGIADLTQYDQFEQGRNRDGYGQFAANWPHTHGAPAYWGDQTGGSLYTWSEKDYLRKYSYSATTGFNHVPVAIGAKRIRRDTMPSGILSVAGNTAPGSVPIVWAAEPIGHEYWGGAPIQGILRAFRGDTLQELWNSGNDVNGFPKFCPPTIANGNVYFPNWGTDLNDGPFEVFVYGPTTLSKTRSVYRGPDFDGDGQVDVLWRNEASTNGQNSVWLLHPWMSAGVAGPGVVGNDTALFAEDGQHTGAYPFTTYQYASIVSEGPVSNNWHIKGTGDFNQDGITDIVWSQSRLTGNFQINNTANSVWIMRRYCPAAADNSTANECQSHPNEVPVAHFAFTEANPGLDWAIRAVGDFNQDGISDLVWRNQTTGENSIWIMKAWVPTGGACTDPNGCVSKDHVSSVVSQTGTWDIVGSGDWDGDGVSDLVWRDASGKDSVWLMNADSAGVVAPKTFPDLPAMDATWSLSGVEDYNGDGHPDLLWRNYGSGVDKIWLMSGAQPDGSFIQIASNPSRVVYSPTVSYPLTVSSTDSSLPLLAGCPAQPLPSTTYSYAVGCTNVQSPTSLGMPLAWFLPGGGAPRGH